ncbi:MAG TPA: hypothetical protein VLE89_07735 [Chlamydiales bacterium]|nr:hypothetical protein [Chlamydiales bacterium]
MVQVNGQFLTYENSQIPIHTMESFQVDRKQHSVRILCRSQWNERKLRFNVQFDSAKKVDQCTRLLMQQPMLPRTATPICRRYTVTAAGISPSGDEEKEFQKLVEFFTLKGVKVTPKLMGEIGNLIETARFSPIKQELEWIKGHEDEVMREIDFVLNGPSKEELAACLINTNFAGAIADDQQRARIEKLIDYLRGIKSAGSISPKQITDTLKYLRMVDTSLCPHSLADAMHSSGTPGKRFWSVLQNMSPEDLNDRLPNWANQAQIHGGPIFVQ